MTTTRIAPRNTTTIAQTKSHNTVLAVHSYMIGAGGRRCIDATIVLQSGEIVRRTLDLANLAVIRF